MRILPVSEANHGLVMQPDPNNLSIRIRPDGFSCAYMDGDTPRIRHVDTSPQNLAAELETVLKSDPDFQREFSGICVCVSTEKVFLVPDELDQPEKYDVLFNALGFDTTSGFRVAASSGEGREYTLLFAVEEKLVNSLEGVLGANLVFYHPLSVSLAQKGEGVLLQADVADDRVHLSLGTKEKPVYAESFPVNTEADLLLLINRLVVSHKIGVFNLLCSGGRCEALAALFRRYYRHVSVHADGTDRDLLFPLRCE